jgi:hypothetical protein
VRDRWLYPVVEDQGREHRQENAGIGSCILQFASAQILRGHSLSWQIAFYCNPPPISLVYKQTILWFGFIPFSLTGFIPYYSIFRFSKHLGLGYFYLLAANNPPYLKP